jgi:predicted small secreted protein
MRPCNITALEGGTIIVIARRKVARHAKGFFMKNLYKKLGIAALAVAVVFSFAACDTGGGGGGDVTSAAYSGYDGSGNTYTLTISDPSKAAYSPKAGDKYKLEISGLNKTSTGTVDSFSNNTFALSASKGGTFTVTVNDKGIEGITGTITYDDNSTEPGPGTVTPGRLPTVTVSQTNGQITITDIPTQYNGKFAFATDFETLMGAANISLDEKFTLGTIDNRSVTLKVWKKFESGNSHGYANYNGTGNVQICVKIFDIGTITLQGGNANVPAGMYTVSFNNGIGTVSASTLQ